MGKSLTFFVLSFLPISLLGQNTIGLPLMVNYSKNDYHAGTQNWDIKQDRFGRMYFANNEGLVTFDGSFWKVHPQPNNTILRSIAIDNERIYAGGQDEIGYFEADKQGILHYFSLLHLLPKRYNKFGEIWDIETYKNSVFFRCWDKIFEYRDQTFRVYSPPSGWQIIKKAGEKLIAQDFERGLFEFRENSWQPITSSPFTFGVITGIAELNADSLLIGTLLNGIVLYANGNYSQWKTEADKALMNNHIYTFEKLNQNEFVAGTTSGGCIVFSNSGKAVQYLGMTEGLQNNNVLSLFTDKGGNLWAGLNNGISFIAYNVAVKYIKPSNNTEVSGYSILINDNKLYLATSDGAFSAQLQNNSPVDLSFSKSDFTLIKNSSGQAWRIAEINNNILIGHHTGCFLIKNDEAKQLTSDLGIWFFLPTSPILPSYSVITGTYSGISMLRFNGSDFSTWHTLKGDYESLRFLALDNDNSLWASHPYRGIYRINISMDSMSFSTKLYTETDGLPSRMRNHVFRIKNRVVFATEKGVYEFDNYQNRFTPSTNLYQTFGNIWIQYLNEDSEGNIWFCSGKKIGVASPASINGVTTYAITYFPEMTGKILSGFESIYPYSKENIFIASEKGVMHLNYKKYISNTRKITLLLSQVMSFGKKDSLVFGGYRNSTISNQPVASFPSKTNSFHFEFSAPDYGLQNNIEYSYQLEGYDSRWSGWTFKTEKDYTNLPHGTYTFKVIAHDNLGNKSEVESFTFKVLPPWYKTNIAYLTFTMLFLFLAFILYKRQQKKFMQQETKFAEEQKKLKYIHQLELEKTEKELIKLQNEKLTNEIFFKNKELADASMQLVERGDALIKVKDGLQKLYKKNSENHDVKNVLRLVNDIEKSNSNWEQFALHFDDINNDFLKKLKVKFPKLTNTDLKVCAYLQLKLSTKEIAQLLNISIRGVEISRYRLRKKLQLSTEESLTDFLNTIK